MQDHEFHLPEQKTLNPDDPSANLPPNSALAVISLVFGIVGWVVLPLIGPIIALITGHLAMGEINESGGRLGGRALARAGLMLAYSWFGVVLVAIGVVLALLGFKEQRTFPQPPTPVLSTPAFYSGNGNSPGVKFANEMTAEDLETLKSSAFAADPEHEDILCYYRDFFSNEVPPPLAVLTTKRLATLKGDRVTSFDLKDIRHILGNDAYQRKYIPNPYVDNRYRLEVTDAKGRKMRIVIQSLQDGPVFYQALLDACKDIPGLNVSELQAK